MPKIDIKEATEPTLVLTAGQMVLRKNFTGGGKKLTLTVIPGIFTPNLAEANVYLKNTGENKVVGATTQLVIRACQELTEMYQLSKFWAVSLGISTSYPSLKWLFLDPAKQELFQWDKIDSSRPPVLLVRKLFCAESSK